MFCRSPGVAAWRATRADALQQLEKTFPDRPSAVHLTAVHRRAPAPSARPTALARSDAACPARTTNRADMCIGDAYGAAHVVDGEDPHRVVAVLRRAGRTRCV